MLDKYFSPDNETPDTEDPPAKIYLTLPFKSQKLTQRLRQEIQPLNRRLNCNLQPTFYSRKIGQLVKRPEVKDALVANSRCVYLYTCTCDMRYVGHTNRHLHQRVAEHQRAPSAIYRHCKSTGHIFNEGRFAVRAKCKTKFECLARESIEIHFRKPELNARDEFSPSTCILYGH